jgi:hypothetical protein
VLGHLRPNALWPKDLAKRRMLKAWQRWKDGRLPIDVDFRALETLIARLIDTEQSEAAPVRLPHRRRPQACLTGCCFVTRLR